MPATKGINFARRLTGGVSKTNVSQMHRDILQGGTSPLIQRAIVVDVLEDPQSLTDQDLDRLEDSTVNPELVEGMPPNSILARVVTNSQDLGNAGLHVFYPLFSSHVQLPVKPGEQVLILYEDYSGTGNSFGYWITRPVAAIQAEDLNYTHHDRFYDPTNHPRGMDAQTKRNLRSSAPSFPNGAGSIDTYSLQQSENARNPYDLIVTSASSSVAVFNEPVPRTKKRPGDLALFGSNNTAILLGTDRTGPIIPVTSSSEQKDLTELAGAIDIVAGLGSIRKLPSDENVDPSDNNKNPTSPRVITNTRGKKEVYKTPYKSQKKDNPKEGDPDFKRDLSRIYVSMKTKGDKNFGIKLGGNGGIYPNSNQKLSAEIKDLPDDGKNGQPYIIAKSEHVRIIATGKDSENGPSESGDIRFVKEGTESDKDLSLFVMAKDGRVVMVGKDIQMQTHDQGQVLLRCKNATEQESDPVVLYSKFKECIEEIQNKMNSLKTTIGDQIQALGDQGLTVLNAAGPFSPIPGLLSLKAVTRIAGQTIKTTNTSFTNKISPCRSKWVFINKESQG